MSTGSCVATIAITFGQKIERDERGWHLLRELGDARGGRMKAQLQAFEVETIPRRDHDLPIENAAFWKRLQERVAELREIAIERTLIAALKIETLSIAKYQRSKSVPFRLKNPPLTLGDGIRQLREHRLDRRIDRKARHRDRILSSSGFVCSRVVVDFERFLGRPQCVGHMLEVDANPSPCRVLAAHRIDENITWLEMRGRLGVPRLPAFQSLERIVLLCSSRDFDERTRRNTS